MMQKYLLLILLLSSGKAFAQQWDGPINKDSAIFRQGGLTIGLDSLRYKGPNVIHLAKHVIVRSKVNGDLFDVVNDQQNLGDGSDVIWAAVSQYQSSKAGLLTLSSPVSSTTGAITRFTVRCNGNVGIGIHDPVNKLDVNGTIHAKEVKIDNTGWADYVFDKDYSLMSLEKLNNFIKTNKHLPNIPSTDVVAKEGINVSEITTKLLSKIEELTLYIIQQNQTLSKQQVEIDELQKQIGK